MSKKKAAKPIGTKPAAKAQGVKRGEPAKAGARLMPPAKSAKAPVKPAAKAAAKAPASAKGEAKTVKGAAPKGAAVVKTGGKTASAPARTMAAAREEPAKKTQGESKKMAARAKVSEIVLPAGYRPAENEPFMNEMHRAYFRKRLLEWKDEILRQTRETLAILHEDSTQHADLADRATSETDRATELRTRDRQRKLIAKIDAALSRIEDGSYGYCEETGEPIGLKRLDARPIATLSVEAQERHERRERVYREE